MVTMPEVDQTAIPPEVAQELFDKAHDVATHGVLVTSKTDRFSRYTFPDFPAKPGVPAAEIIIYQYPVGVDVAARFMIGQRTAFIRSDPSSASFNAWTPDEGEPEGNIMGPAAAEATRRLLNAFTPAA